MINFEKLKSIINQHSSFLLTTHINPDADAIGSEIAFANILKKLGKSVEIVNISETPDYLEFLDSEKIIQKYNVEKHLNYFDNFDVLVALDFNHSGRIGEMQKGFLESSKYKICIDHHTNPEDFVDEIFYDTSISSTGEIVYKFIDSTKIVQLDYNISLALYAAVVTDTGSFKYDRTTSYTLRMAAEFLDQGVVPHLVLDKIYDQGSFNKTKLLGAALSSITLTSNKKASLMIITKEMMKETNTIESDIEGFVNFGLGIKGVKLALLLVELDNCTKISFRSKGSIPVNKFASEYGGGGHVNASGARVENKDITDLTNELLIKAADYSEKF